MKQTPWLDRNFDFKRDAGAWPVIVCRIQGTAPRLHALVSGLSDAHTSGQLEGKWSIKDHIGHLTDLEALWLGRLQDFNANLEVLRPADMSNAATHKADHSSVSLIRLLSDFETQRAQLVEALHQVTQQKVCGDSLP